MTLTIAAGSATRHHVRTTRRVGGQHVVWLLLIAATIPWRKDVYFDGGLDSVVIAKAGISILALLLAAHLAGGARAMSRVPAPPVLMLLLYLSVTVIGGLADGGAVASSIVAVRVALLSVAICFLFHRYAAEQVIGSLVGVMGTLVVAASVSGLPSAASGRLAGTLPPMNPNELGFMASVCFLWLYAKLLRASESRLDLGLAAGAVVVVLLTGSRSSLAALCVAVVVMTLRATAMTPRSIGAAALMAPLVGYVALGTDVLSSVFLRGGERGITTLSNRTVAWDAALTSDRDPWDTWFGAGLATKKIAVPGQWWNVQLLDSSYISAIVQGGLIGASIVALILATTLVRSAMAARPSGALWLGLTVYLAGRAVLESGLFDSTSAFMVLMVTMLGCRVGDQAGNVASGGSPLSMSGRDSSEAPLHA